MTQNKKNVFEKIYEENYAMVHQLCFGYMKGDEAMAMDLLQETFINLWNSLDKFKGDSSYKTWVYRIAINTCLQQIRKNKNLQKVSISEIVERAPGNELAKTDRYMELYQAIGKLNEIDRLIIMMVLDELEYTEIANVMGLEATNLRVKIHRIKKNLKKILEDERAK